MVKSDGTEVKGGSLVNVTGTLFSTEASYQAFKFDALDTNNMINDGSTQTFEIRAKVNNINATGQTNKALQAYIPQNVTDA